MKFKLKKIRLTKGEKGFACILIVMVGFLAFWYPKKGGEMLAKNTVPSEVSNPVNKTVEKPVKLKYTLEDIIAKTTVPGEKISIVNLNDKFVIFNYLLDGKEKALIVDFNTAETKNADALVKLGEKDNFLNKIDELLKLKYPGKIVDILKAEANKEYTFYDEYMIVNYYDALSLSKAVRKFNLKVYYNEIKEYLTFKPALIEEYQNENGFELDPNKVTIAFTFDDGPAGNRTIEIVNKLEEYRQSATFFMVANKLESSPDAVRAVAKSHSEVGYHSLAHNSFTKQTPEEIASDFTYSNGILENIAGVSFKLTRPPYGSYNETVLNAIDNAFIRWNVDTEDWKYKDSDYVYNYVMENYHDGDIILMHDIHETTKEAALKLIEDLYLQDIQVVSVSNLARVKGQSLDNHEVYYYFK